MKKGINIFIIAIFFLTACASPKKPTVTFADVAPVIYKSCSPCHRPGQSGPFDLLTYNDCKNKALTIKFTTENKLMPPWPADPSYQHYIGEKYLSDDEIKLITDWVEQGAQRGDSSIIHAAPKFPDGSFIGKPDVVGLRGNH